MPRYDFRCKCGLIFGKMLPMARAEEPQRCPSCNSMSQRDLPTGASVTFQSSSSLEQLTPEGVQALEEHIDRVIGEDSKKRWATISQRQKRKLFLIHSHEGVKGTDIMRDPEQDGDYLIGKPELRDRAKGLRDVGNMAVLEAQQQHRQAVKSR